MIYVFVYGTLRPSLYPHRKLNGTPARIDAAGWRFMNIRGKFPAAVALGGGYGQDQGLRPSTFAGEIVAVDNLSEFDAYAGYQPNASAPSLFLRSPIVIKSMYNVSSAIIYYMTEPMLNTISKLCPVREITSGDWASEVRG